MYTTTSVHPPIHALLLSRPSNFPLPATECHCRRYRNKKTKQKTKKRPKQCSRATEGELWILQQRNLRERSNSLQHQHPNTMTFHPKFLKPTHTEVSQHRAVLRHFTKIIPPLPSPQGRRSRHRELSVDRSYSSCSKSEVYYKHCETKPMSRLWSYDLPTWRGAGEGRRQHKTVQAGLRPQPKIKSCHEQKMKLPHCGTLVTVFCEEKEKSHHLFYSRYLASSSQRPHHRSGIRRAKLTSSSAMNEKLVI